MLIATVDIREYLEAEHARVQAEIDDLSRSDFEVAHVELRQDRVLQTNLDRLWTQIEKALLSFEKGTYGVCEACGGIRGPDRVHALRRHCVLVSYKRSQEGVKRGSVP